MTDKAITKAILNLGLAHRWYINAPSHLSWDFPVARPVVVSQVRRFLEDTVEAPIPEAPLYWFFYVPGVKHRYTGPRF